MTEAEWRTSGDPNAMVRHLQLNRRKPGVASGRKFRLFAVAAIRPHLGLLTDSRSVAAVSAAEDAADQPPPGPDLIPASRAAWDVLADNRDVALQDIEVDAIRAAARTAQPRAVDAADLTINEVRGLEADLAVAAAGETHAPDIWWAAAGVCDYRLVAYLRDIFGNPFRPVAVEPEWRTETVVALARGTYDDRAFDRLPVLADALDDAGCDNADLLGHCRDRTLTHVRGCWAVDLLLGLS